MHTDSFIPASIVYIYIYVYSKSLAPLGGLHTQL